MLGCRAYPHPNLNPNSNPNPDPNQAAAWDSGGASFQITGRDGPPSVPVAAVAVRAFTATLGTGPAFERLLVQVQRRP